jgi:NhaP-type Na+/H+ and K+/H+ antiporter
MVQVFTMAFLVVGATCVAMVPIMLYMLDLRKYGWEWIHACMFGAMIASTDAVAIVSIMKTSECGDNMHLEVSPSTYQQGTATVLHMVFWAVIQQLVGDSNRTAHGLSGLS